MFLGYQKEIIAMIGSTREELERNERCKFDRIEETDKEYFLYQGNYVCEIPLEEQVAEMDRLRSEAYVKEVDTKMAEYTRKKTFNLFKEGEEQQLLSEIEIAVDNIKVRYPYPEQNLTEMSEDVIVESEEDETV